MKIGIQGEKFSWHYLAAKKLYGNDAEILFYKEFSEVFRAKDNNEIDFGLVAIENSIYGSIISVYQELSKRHYFINGEVKLEINQCLMSSPTTKLTELTDVYSHPVALNQCRDWLEKNLPKVDQHAYFDTAISAKKVANSTDKIAAIGPKELSNEWGLNILAKNISIKQNYTRFISFSNKSTVYKSANKTSAILTTSHSEGALYRALGCFSGAKLNLTKLESHPIQGRPFEYQFYIDLEARSDNPQLQSALEQLARQGSSLQIIGCYKADSMI